jgi:protocatechuate 3,4-dioxygenase beta subunit
VVDADGKPVPDATVYYPVAEMPPQPLGLTSQVTTGADGSFTIDDPIEHRALLLRACKDGRITEEDVRVDPDRTDALGDRMLYVTLRLGKRRLAVLRGTVVDDAGKPVAGAAVSPAPGFRPDLSADPPLPRTDAAGQYRMEIWPGLSYQVAAWASEHGIGMGQRLTAHPGENPPLAPITIPRAGSFLDVLIADAEGRPVSNAPVSITVPDGQPFLFNRDRRTDSQGRLYVLGVLPATYSLEIRTGERVTQAKVTAGVRGIRITVPTAQTPH